MLFEIVVLTDLNVCLLVELARYLTWFMVSVDEGVDISMP